MIQESRPPGIAFHCAERARETNRRLKKLRCGGLGPIRRSSNYFFSTTRIEKLSGFIVGLAGEAPGAGGSNSAAGK